MLYYTSVAESGTDKPGIFTLDPEKGNPILLKEGKGLFKQIAFDEKGERIAFLYCAEKDSSYKAMSLWLSERNQPAKEVASRGNKAFPEGWVISEHGKLSFSKSGAHLFFGTSPEPLQKDTTILDEYHATITVHEGKYHEIKRIFGKFSYDVIRLERIAFGPLSLGGLSLGTCRLLTREEYFSLLASVRLRQEDLL